MNTYPRETKEFIAVSVSIKSGNTTIPVNTNVKLCLVPFAARPVTWVDPLSLDGKIGLMIDHLDKGKYRIWAQITDAPEIPVVDCGSFVVN